MVGENKSNNNQLKQQTIKYKHNDQRRNYRLWLRWWSPQGLVGTQQP